ncbi:hypothetical protein [Mesorhizobium sophorae]|nr:hypothetical protein [Mesorhizobium sophorae]
MSRIQMDAERDGFVAKQGFRPDLDAKFGHSTRTGVAMLPKALL